ncbi:MAG: PEP-CTERM sorting domain-containing protein [Planctomycetaceae bacterium]|nr:PEP-CTERM sorting domain-containing protein [Planctomycetaceae bacterium]MBV8310499.1 PEP-CTERM sorting domain-containing protein [Planctomycetaceae bacterium]
MRQLSFATATLCLLLVVPPTTRAGQIIYDIQNYPADQNGHIVSGNITTDGFIGQLAPDDILSWSVTIDGTQTFTSTDVGAHTLVLGVQSNPTDLTMGTPPTGSASLQIATEVGEGGTLLLYSRPALATGANPVYQGEFDGKILWRTLNPLMDGTNPWVLAVAPASAVPEPSSLWLLGTAITAGLAYGWSRHRRIPASHLH